jgi:hypothetical protein
MLTQPRGEHLSSAIVEQINWPMRLQVDEQGAVATWLAAQCDVIDTEHSRCVSLVGTAECMQKTKERVRADRHTRLAREPGAAFTTRLHGEGGEQVGRPIRAASVVCQRAIEPLGEDPSRAAWRIAEPPPRVDAHAHRPTAPGQIERAALVAAVLTPTLFAALRARNCRSCRFDDQNQAAVTFDNHQNDAPAFVRPRCPSHRDHRHSPRWPR